MGSDYDQLQTSGTVSLNNAALQVSLGYVPAVGTVFTLISNGGGSPVRGTFAGLPEGSLVTLDGGTFQISYVGGASGQDVTLTVEVVNHAPVLTAANPDLGSTDVDTAQTFSLSKFINNGAGTTTITDVDPNTTLGGIALTGTTGQGTWSYSLDGTTFFNVGTVSDTQALLLPADAELRYQPDLGHLETATITYRGWDKSSGSAGSIVDASHNGNTTPFSSSTDTASLTVNKANQTITFTAPASPITFVPNETVNLSASASSGDQVAFSIDASSTGTGSISGSTLTVTGTGTFVLDANQAGDSNYNAAAQVQQTLVVNQADQTISFTAPTSPITFVPNETINLSASVSSGDQVAFSIDASSSGTGNISGSTLTVTGAGSIVLDANQAGDSNYNAAAQVQQTLVVNKADQTINFTAPNSPITFVPNETINLSASASSGDQVAFSIDASSTGTGSISGSTLTVTGPGSIVLDASQAGDSNYNAASQVQQTLVVNKADQTINFTAPNSPITFVPNETVNLNASGGASGNPVVFRIDASSTGTGTINGNTLTVTGPGSIVIDANQAGDSNYNAAAQVQQTLVTQLIPYTPSGLIAASSGYDRPTFSWNAVAGAAHYSLVVVDSTTNTIALDDPNIASTYYTTTTAQTLTPGDSYTWYIGSVADNAAPQYHSLVTFTLAALAAPTLTGPNSLIAASSGYALPTLTWTTVAGASSYAVFLYDQTVGAWDLYGQIAGSSGSYTPSTPLTPGHSYVWTVAALSSNGQAATFASGPEDFQLAALAAPTLTGPNGLIAASSGSDLPTLTWNTVAGASSYAVFLYDQTAGAWDLYGQIAGSSGSYTPSTPLTPGHSYLWIVAALSSNGQAATFASGPEDFQLAALAAPTLTGPSGLIAASSGSDLPTLSWNTVAGAASYGVYLYDQTVGAWVLYDQKAGSAGSYTLSTPLTPGHSYLWTVAALSSNGQAATFASGPDDFQLAALAAPRLTGPSGLIAASSGYDLPTLTWNTVAGAGSYAVFLYDQTAGAWDLYGQIAGSSGSYTLSTPLTPGHSYLWTVAALSNNVQAATFASGPDDFQLAALAAPSLTGPSGLIAASSGYDLPTLTWNTVAGAASYGVDLYDQTVGAWVLYDQKAGSAGSYTLSTPLTPGHSYMWIVSAVSSNGQADTFATGWDVFQLAAPS